MKFFLIRPNILSTSIFKNIVPFLLYLVFIPAVLSQNQVTFRQLSVKNGLSQNSAISITQDSIGYLWIATQDGLNKYDGRKFISYPYQFIDITRPNYSNLGKIYTDREGQLWIIPKDKLLYKFYKNTEKFSPIKDIKEVYTIFQDQELNYWISTYKGVFFINKITNELKNALTDENLEGVIYDIQGLNEDTVLLANENKILEINIHTKKILNRIPEKNSEHELKTRFSSIAIDSSGKLWMGTFGNGLYYRNSKSNILNRISENLFIGSLPLNLNILDLHVDSKNRLWIATYGSGLYMINLNTKKIENFSVQKHNPRALHYDDILSIHEDYLGTLWFGTDGAGVSYYDEYLEKFNSLTNSQTDENINIDVVRSIAVDANNTIWIGTSGKGLTSYKKPSNLWKTYTTENSNIPSNRIMSLLIDDDDDLWIGTLGNGLSILKKDGSFINYSESSKIPLTASTIWDILKDTKGQYWLATNDNGLIQFDKNLGELKKITHNSSDNKSLPDNNIRVITEDNKHNLWLGTYAHGLVKFNPDKNTYITYTVNSLGNSLSSNSIKSLLYDENNVLWVGTNGNGLNALEVDKEKFHHYSVDDGLANDVIYSILKDTEESLWLSSNKGITKFTPNVEFENKPLIVNYNNYDGLATEFNTGADFIDRNGNFYFGGIDGFYWFQPKEIKDNTILPKTAITSFEVLNELYPMTNETVLDHDQNTLSFTFSSLQFSLPEKNMYEYRLKNYEKDWVNAGNNNYVRYTRLPPGSYEFEVRSSNYDGVWNKTPVVYKFSISEPWYLTPLSKFLYVFILMGLCFGIYRYLKWRWEMQLNLKLKEDEAQQLKELNDFKSKLYTDIAHEFRTPLTLISGPIDSKLTSGNLSEYDRANFSIIKRNAHRLTSLVDQLLELAKLEEGRLNINVSKGDLSLFLHTITNSFEYQAHLKKIEYNIHIQPFGKVWYDEDIIEKIISNLLSNAFKYSPDKGVCEFLATREDNFIKISVKNTVLHGSKLQLEKMFTRFYQYDTYSEGMGVGLSLVNALVKLYAGTINVDMEENEIIHFQVVLPITRDSFKEEDIRKTSMTLQSQEVISEFIDVDEDSIDSKQEDLPILLIVEDYAEVRTFIKQALKKKYRILEAENGKVGLEIALSEVPDIILSDIRMPIYNGIQLCNALKIDERTSHIPIILLTAGVSEENELKGLASGADDFVTKPFKIKVLEQRMINLIATRRALRNRYSQELILKPKEIAITPADEIFLNRIQEIIENHLSDPQFNAHTFSQKLKVSRMQLHRKLLAYTGLSTSAFIRSQRLKQAIQILQTSDATINEVAYAVGFNTPTYFMKCFKEVYKKTPSEYLQSLK